MRLETPLLDTKILALNLVYYYEDSHDYSKKYNAAPCSLNTYSLPVLRD
jgi:hypothetical protein